MNNKLRIHSHPAMEKKLEVPDDHVIIDAELYMELVKRFGSQLPSLPDLSYEETINFMRDRIANATAIPEHMLKGNPK
jgi:hypothetical protein